MTERANSEPGLTPDLLAPILLKLGMTGKRSDLAGLNRLYGAYYSHIPNDNLKKRIWLAGDRTKPVTGGDPSEYFENWLIHGTGGTCFPASGGLCTPLRVIGFDAIRISGTNVLERIEQRGNHGSVLVTLDGGTTW